ncbi:MAG: diadenylate cyclase CdaA [Candidatus Aminicenantia bacterium]
MSEVINALSQFSFVDLIDIFLVSFILYHLFLLIKDTKAYQMAVGLAIIGFLYIVTKWTSLTTSNWLIRNFFTYLIIAIIVLFQEEIRRFLAELGSRTLRRRPFSSRTSKESLEEIVLAADFLSQKKIGALIAIEKEIALKGYADRGTKIGAEVSRDLLISLFFPRSPLHDGAVIVQNNKITAAGCLLPLPPTHTLGEEFSPRTRHLAAVGLSQETDAAVVVVSEETGKISLAIKGNLERNFDREKLLKRLLNYLEGK